MVVLFQANTFTNSKHTTSEILQLQNIVLYFDFE